MLGALFVFLLVVLCGFAAILFSVFAWRLNNDIFFYLGLICTSILIIYAAINYEHLYYLMINSTMWFLIQMSFIVCPIYFLIQAKTNSPNNSFDGSEASGKVTEDYLDEIINSPDEEIDFEEDLDLK